MKKCSVEGCENKLYGRGWCEKHYTRWRNHGDPLHMKRKTPNPSPPDTCTIDNCNKKHFAKGWCSAHYHRARRNGSPTGGGVPPGALMRWLEKHVSHTGSDCLIWPFSSKSNGYGVVYYNGEQRGASRVMCILAHGDPPSPKMHAAHSCGKGHLGCVNPGHLRWATEKENHADKKLHGTLLYGEAASNAKLTENQAREIKRLKGLVPGRQLAKDFGVHFSTISSIHTGARWKHIDDEFSYL